MRFYIVDAFSNVSFKGNPAAVVLADRTLDENEYLEISGEFNLRSVQILVKIPSYSDVYDLIT